jgi:transcriptional regulator with XRE-family HTH domain
MGRREIDDSARTRAELLTVALAGARDLQHLSVQDLSTASGVHYETVRSLLAGKSAGPSFFIVADLARALEVPLDQLDARTKP